MPRPLPFEDSPRTRTAGLVGSSILVLVGLFTPSGPAAAWAVPTPREAVFAAALIAVLLFRRRAPRTVLTLVLALCLLSLCTGGHTPAMTSAIGVGSYSASQGLERTQGVVWTIGAGVVMLIASFWIGDFGAAFAAVLGGAIGDAVKSHRVAVREALERADHAEATREAEAQRRVAEDRLSIARDLHDVVAHQIAVINLHAGLADATAQRDPEASKASLGIVRGAAQSALSEIGGLLATLRDPDTATTSAPRLDRLGDLVREAESRGLRTTLTVSGEEQELSYATDVTAFRVIQESLTNAHKHGTGAASVAVTYAQGELLLVVTNEIKEMPDAGGRGGAGGRGLTGMRERVASVKGHLDAGRAGNGTWMVRAALPMARGGAAEATKEDA